MGASTEPIPPLGEPGARVEPLAPAARGLGRDRSLPWRLFSAVVFLPILIAAVQLGGPVFFAVAGLVISIGLWEFYALMSAQGFRPYRWLGLGTGALVAWFVFAGLPTHANLFLTAFLLGTTAIELLRPRDHGVAPMSVTIFGVLYVGWLGSHLLYLRELPTAVGLPYASGAAFVFLALLPTWACDTIAYAIGLVFGRIRPWPHVSPKKSLEGSIAGLVAALVATLVARAWFAPFLPLGQAILLGLAIGVFAQVGDLVESLLKRTSQAKDSSRWIPGHGGVLDRFDSLFFTAPLVYYYLKLVVLGES